MSPSTPACATCQTPLPADAVFCHRCGARTPQEISKATGEIKPQPVARERDQMSRLQLALGNTYEVRRLLGRGGFAEVYVAYDMRLKREVAVKTLRGDIVASDTLLDRFQREAEAVAKLRHPNVVPIFSVGEGEGLAYYTMPLIEGDSLATVLDRDGRLPIVESARILRDAAYALHAAHRAGIVHRDIKPENIMLEGPERAVVVMDFGIAKTTSGGVEEVGLTGTGMLVGTPQYMSPEQATGERTLDHRTDQYSLAMVGYRMVTGKLPFDHESVQTILFKTVTELPPTPSAVASDVPDALSETLMKALAKKSEDRFDTMGEFATALNAVIAEEQDARSARKRRRQTSMTTRIATARAWMKRDKALWIGAVAAAGLAATLMALSYPRTVRRLVGERDAAIFAAQTLANTKGTPQLRRSYAEMTQNDSALSHLRHTTGYAKADERAQRDIPVWEWNILMPSSGNKDTLWEVSVAPHSRITGYRLPRLQDTSAGARISFDSARALAEAAVAERGWSVKGLRRLADSSVQRRGRTDHLVRWVADSASVTPAGDSARTSLRVSVAGDRVVEYRERFGRFGRRSPADSAPIAIGGLVGVSAIAIVMGLMIAAVRWSRDHDLQWGMVFRVLVVGGLLLAVPFIASLARAAAGGVDANNSGVVSMIVVAILVIIFFGVIALTAGVVGESLAQSRRPEVVEGIADVSRGRLLVPELVPAAAIGYACGSLAVLATGAMTWAALRFGWHTDLDPTEMFSFAPALGAFTYAGLAVLLSVALLAGVMPIAAWRWTSRLRFVLPGIAAATVVYVSSDGGLASPVVAFIATNLIAVALWYGGMLGGFVAILVTILFESAFLGIWGGGYALIGGVTALAIMLAPAVMAFVMRRRLGGQMQGS